MQEVSFIKVAGISREIQLIRRRMKTMTLRIYPDGSVIVRAPYSTSLSLIRSFVESHAASVEEKILESRKQNAEAEAAGYFTAEELERMKTLARQVIPPRVAYFAEKLGVTYGKITIRSQKARWGSCTGDGNLSFNCLLTQMPQEIQDSVIVHELCHRLHLNHSPAFYAEIYRVMPREEYQRCQAWLAQQGMLLLRRRGG